MPAQGAPPTRDLVREPQSPTIPAMNAVSPAAPHPIAIDGPAASGKTTVGAALAERYGLQLLDTGVTYRAFTLMALERGLEPGQRARCAVLARALEIVIQGASQPRISVNGVDVTDRLREPDVEHNVSAFSAIPSVRRVMVGLQRRIARERPSVVIGRDIGTVVLPNAPVKLFLTASDESRATRRARQSEQWGTTQDVEVAGADIEQRDRLDSNRQASPLRAAPDAVVIDTTAMTLPEVIAEAIRIVECARG